MKRYNNLLPKILDKENLYLAYWKARRGKEAKQEVFKFSSDLERNVDILANQIATQQFPVCEYNKFTIHDPKERTISAAPFHFRVLHHALMNVCGPLLDKRLIDDCFASRIGKGTYAAIERARYYHRRFDYCVKMDIRKYFESIDHLILKRQLSRVFKEPGLLQILYYIIDGYETQPNKGLPIGNLTSQYFANHYLCALDHYGKEELKIKGYVRYMDDVLIYGDDRNELISKAKMLRSYLESELKLELKVMDLRCTTQTTQFLGYRLTKRVMLLSKRSKKRFRHKLKDYFEHYNKDIMDEKILYNHLVPLVGFVMKAQCKDFRKNALKKAI